MKKTLLFLLPFCLFLAACNSYSPKNYKKYRGISYEQYEQEKLKKEQDLMREQQAEILESDINTPEIEEESIEDIVESTNSTYGDAVVVMASKKIPLSKDASSLDMRAFQTALDRAYRTALRQYRAAGFTYAISPAGTVNPLSVMDVQCILSEDSADAKGKATCDLFFSEIPQEYEKEKAK